MGGAETRALRLTLGLALRDVARQAGVPESRLCRWERHGTGLSQLGRERVIALVNLRQAERAKHDALARLGAAVIAEEASQ